MKYQIKNISQITVPIILPNGKKVDIRPQQVIVVDKLTQKQRQMYCSLGYFGLRVTPVEVPVEAKPSTPVKQEVDEQEIKQEVNIKAMTKPALIEYASSLGLTIDTKLTKADIINLIEGRK